MTRSKQDLPFWGLVVLFLGACATTRPLVAPITYGGFPTDGARKAACLDMRDHVVDLYVAASVAEGKILFESPAERQVYRDLWANELAKDGTFAHFEQVCFATLKTDLYVCAMDAKTVDEFEGCSRGESPKAPAAPASPQSAPASGVPEEASGGFYPF